LPSFQRIAAAGAASPLARGTVALVVLLLAAAAVVVPSRPANAVTAVRAGSVGIDFVDAGIWGGDLRSTYALTSKTVSAQFYARKRFAAGSGAALVTAVVERRTAGGSWKATAGRVSSRSAIFRAHLPAYSARSSAHDATVAYRLRVRTGGVVGQGDTSATITVHYRNPRHFGAVAASLQRTVHGYCPSAVVRIVHLTGDAAGDYTTGQYALRIDSTVLDYRAIDRRAVALHECGHYLQWRNYGATDAGATRMTRDANAIFGTNSDDPVEHMADCIAQAANPGGYLGYGGSCTKGQKAASERMLHGHRAR
jgi:hypothetical protein